MAMCIVICVAFLLNLLLGVKISVNGGQIWFYRFFLIKRIFERFILIQTIIGVVYLPGNSCKRMPKLSVLGFRFE